MGISETAERTGGTVHSVRLCSGAENRCRGISDCPEFISDQMLVSQKGQKIHSTIYKDAGWTLCPVSIIKNSADKEVAQAFVDYCLTKEAGEILVRTTNGVACNPDVAPPEGQKPLSELPLFKEYNMEKPARTNR